MVFIDWLELDILIRLTCNWFSLAGKDLITQIYPKTHNFRTVARLKAKTLSWG